MTNEVEIVIQAHDNASRVVSAVASRIAGGLRALTSAAGRIGTVVAAAAAAAPVAGRLLEVGRAAASAAPALLAFGVAGAAVAKTLGLIFAEGSAARQALQPVADAVKNAGAAASRAAAQGLAPLVAGFNRLNMPAVEGMMTRIGTATNRVLRGFLEWANSARGVETIKNILGPIGAAAERLAPAVTRVAISFASMLGRIMGVSLAAGESGLTGILNRLAEKFDKIDAESVSSGFEKIRDAAAKVRDVLSTLTEWIGRAVEFYRRHRTEFGLMADGFAIAAIAFGGPAGIIIGSVSLLIRHFDDLKAAWQRVVDYFNTPAGQKLADDLRQTASVVRDTVVTAFEALGRVIQDKVLPFVRDQLAPAFQNHVLPAVREVAGFVKDTVIPAFERLANLFFDHLAPAFDRVMKAVEDNEGQLSALWDVVKKVIEVVVNLATSVLGAQLVAALFVASHAVAFMIDNLGRLIVVVAQVAAAILEMAANAIHGFRIMLNAALTTVETVIGAFSRLPGPLGAPFRAAAQEVAAFRGRANAELSAAESKVRQTANSINNWLAGIHDKSIEVRVNHRTYYYPATYAQGGTTMIAGRAFPSGMAAGGVAGASRAQGGGPRGSLTWVGEMGRELVRLPYGSRVVPHGQSEQIAARGGRGGPARVVLELRSSGRRAEDLLLELLRHAINVNGGDPVTVLRAR